MILSLLFCIYYEITVLLKYPMTSLLMTPKHTAALSANYVLFFDNKEGVHLFT